MSTAKEEKVLDATNSAALSRGPHYFTRGITNEQLETGILFTLSLVAYLGGPAFDVAGSAWKFRDVVVLSCVSAIVRRTYNARLERAYDAYPELRTQPPKKARSADNNNQGAPGSEETEKKKTELFRDVTGRTAFELALIEYHDRLTMLAHFAMDLFFYAVLGRVLYPRFLAPPKTFAFGGVFSSSSSSSLGGASMFYWLVKLILHHYTLSFGMYWMHRLLHVNQFLWRKIHSYHHYARTPLARATYMDHWLDNTANALIAEIGTQILCPLPKPLLMFSRVFRVCESLEKHSGLSGGRINLAHGMQRLVFPFAQMPHHHDWHHEGFKGSNYTFASIGGVWDVLFGTRHPGRSSKSALRAATPHDDLQNNSRLGFFGAKAKKNPLGAFFDRPEVCPIPTVLFFSAVVAKVAAFYRL